MSGLIKMDNRPSLDEIRKREAIEWSNTWYANAQDFECSRFLFIGDSVTRQYRSSFASCFPNVAVDCFLTSSVFFDGTLFKRQLNSFLEYKYDLIFIHMGGLHGANKEIFKEKNFAEIYKEKLNNLIDYLEARNIVLISASPAMRLENGKYSKKDGFFCEKILFINSLMKQVAEDRNLSFIDLYPYVVENKFKYTDAMHFKEQYQVLIAEKIITDVLKQNKLDDNLMKKFKNAKEKIPNLKGKQLNRFCAFKIIENKVFICFLGIKISFKFSAAD